MYLVAAKNNLFGGYSINKYETLDEAKDVVKELYKNGYKEVHLSQEIPLKITVSVEV